MKKEVILFILILIFSLVLTIPNAYSVYINEVMPNPFDNCFDCTEWLELYSDTSQDLTNYSINTGESKNLTLNTTIQDYLVITKNKTKFLEYWDVSSEKVLELAIGLTNTGDLITLYNPQNETIDYFSYSKDIYNNSWSRIVNGTFISCAQPTPSLINNCLQEEENPPDNSENDDYDEEQESSIEIKDYPDQARFGEKITLDIKVYRGNTGKYAVYAYVQDSNNNRVSDKKTIHIDDKYDTYRNEIKLTLKCLDESGTYKIVVYGLDERDTQSIDIESCFEKDNETNTEVETTDTNVPTTYQNTPLTGSATSPTPISQKTLKSSSLSFLDILPYIMLIIIAALIIYFIIKR